MDEHPHCGVSGCHLLNPDRSHQDSIRRFPDFWSQALILLKIHHFLPNLRIFKRYLCRSKKDLEIYKLRYSEVDQVMGAFFMTRREVIEQIGLLDEGFYIWFEEVDFCRRAKSAGWSIDYTNTAEIFHHFGQSFKQRFSLDKQKIWGNSLSYYFKKHHSFWQYLVIKLLSKVAVGVQYLLKLKT
jgi:GT2 family glycosyltransferase